MDTALPEDPEIKWKSLPTCVIDSSGKFKYIQVQIGNCVYIRGMSRCKTHSDIEQAFKMELKDRDWSAVDYSVNGGGYIRIHNKVITISGTSGAFGRCDHQVAGWWIEKYSTWGDLDLFEFVIDNN